MGSVLQAFDTLLQRTVEAELAAKNRIDEPFRYECLCCGEEVYVAAAKSTKKAAHFRHRRGNSDRECELYLGRMGIDGAQIAAKKRAHIRTEVYYDIKQKMFYIGILFQEEKLKEFEGKSCVLEFFSACHSVPYESIAINQQNFAPDSMVLFPLKLTTNDCYINISGMNYRIRHEILYSNDFPTFFKISPNEDTNGKSKRIVGGKIYTATPYYIIARDRNAIQKIAKHREHVSVNQIDEIDAFGSTVYGTNLQILSANAELVDLFSYFNFDLETAQSVLQLWPPMYSVEGVLCTDGKKAYLSSTFELVPHSNISCETDALRKFDSLFEVDLSYPVQICFNNVDIQFKQQQYSSLRMDQPCEQITAPKVNVTECSSFYLIDADGYRELPVGIHFITESSKIVQYRSNYPVVVFKRPKPIPPSRVELLRDVLSYYKVTLPFDEQLIIGCNLSAVAQSYIEECRITNIINKKALDFIKAGKV